MNWSLKAADTGNADAQSNIGGLYFNGNGVQQDYEQAMNWFIAAANNGSTDAMYSIGNMYLLGNGAPIHIPTAIEWYTKAANLGDKFGQYSLGEIFKNEVGFKDLQKSVNWYQKAADNNHPLAKDYVDELNEQGYYAEEERKGSDYQFLIYQGIL
jgi:TPR repeat protein